MNIFRELSVIIIMFKKMVKSSSENIGKHTKKDVYYEINEKIHWNFNSRDDASQ
jgi:hypothetical protein